MSMRTALDTIKMGESANVAISGDRKTFRACGRHNDPNVCDECGALDYDHIRESGSLFCPEWALRERYGR